MVDAAPSAPYAARLEIDYPGQMDRLSTFFRLIWAIPILVILGLLSGAGSTRYVTEAGKVVESGAGGIAAGLFVATVLMVLFRQRYPRWWFDFALELGRFGARVTAYLLLLTDRYPSTYRGTIGPPRGRLSRRRTRAQPVAATRQMAARTPPLCRAVRARCRGRRGHHHRLVRHPVHRHLSSRVVRFRGRCRPLVNARMGIRLSARNGHIPALQPAVTLLYPEPSRGLFSWRVSTPRRTL